jgi:hypothetical protein
MLLLASPSGSIGERPGPRCLTVAAVAAPLILNHSSDGLRLFVLRATVYLGMVATGCWRPEAEHETGFAVNTIKMSEAGCVLKRCCLANP